MADEEQTVVSQARAGDAEAWSRLFERYRLPLYVYVCELLRQEQPALDVVQESFISAFRYLDQLGTDEKFGSWLFSIAHQKCLQRWRKRQREEPLEPPIAEAMEDPQLVPDEWLIRKEDEQQFLETLGRLPWNQRAVLVLHFIEDFSLDEIAAITGAQLGTVKSRMHYAKQALRKLIERNDA